MADLGVDKLPGARLQAEGSAETLPGAPLVAGLALTAVAPDALVLLAGSSAEPDFAKAVKKALKLDLPAPGRQSGEDPLLIWQGYRRWLLYCRNDGAERLAALAKAFGPEAPLSEVTDGFFVVRIEGEKLRRLLAMGTATDCSAAALPPGSSALLRFAELTATVIVTGETQAELLVERASKRYLWAWLCRAAATLA